MDSGKTTNKGLKLGYSSDGHDRSMGDLWREMIHHRNLPKFASMCPSITHFKQRSFIERNRMRWRIGHLRKE
jgi:hypothetical protein